MLTYYQPFLLPFLHWNTYRVPKDVTQTYFLSFEDALWELLKAINIPKNSTILIPNFYCMDVVHNIRSHGYIPVFYPLNDQFQTSIQSVRSAISKHKPRAIILFHACGISNTIITNPTYKTLFSKKYIVIEDSVHRLVNPSRIKIIHPNHFILDSVRKVSPLSGSFLYSTRTEDLHFTFHFTKEFSYRLWTRIYFLLFRLVFSAGVILRSFSLVTFAHTHILKLHDDIVGDNNVGHKGNWLHKYFHRHIHFPKIETKKYQQVKIYESKLKNIFANNSSWYQICIPKIDKKYLHVYPIGYKFKTSKQIIHMQDVLRAHRIPVWFKFLDAPWSKNRAVLFLPLGFHISNKEIRQICSLLQSIKIECIV